MENTSSGIQEIKEDARRQADATDGLRVEVTQGFGLVGERIARVETKQKAHEENHEILVGPRRGREAFLGGSGLGLGALAREIWVALRGGVS